MHGKIDGAAGYAFLGRYWPLAVKRRSTAFWGTADANGAPTTAAVELVQVGKLDDGTTLSVRVRGKGDPGAESTSRMLVECALCLAEDADRIVVGGGFLTPASAMGDLLLSRLPAHANLTFETLESDTRVEGSSNTRAGRVATTGT